MKIKQNKKGYMRIIEAAIAIVLVLSLMIFIQQKGPKTDISSAVYGIQHQVLNEIEKNEDMRTSVLNEKVSPAVNYTQTRLKPYSLNFEMDICSVDESCICHNCPEDKQIYSDNIIISSSLSEYSPKKLAIFSWN